MEYLTVFLRTLIIYFTVLFIMRLMGKREIGKLSLFDLVVAIMIAELASIIIEDTTKTLLTGIIPIFTLALTQMILSWVSLKNKKVRDILVGKPTVVIERGKIYDQEMARLRYTMDDLLMQLREKNIANIADVEFAILETNGKLSVFPRPEKKPLLKEALISKAEQNTGMPIPLIIDGKVLDENLQKLGLTRFWLKNRIRERHFKNFKEIAYCSIDVNESMFIDKKDK